MDGVIIIINGHLGNQNLLKLNSLSFEKII